MRKAFSIERAKVGRCNRIVDFGKINRGGTGEVRWDCLRGLKRDAGEKRFGRLQVKKRLLDKTIAQGKEFLKSSTDGDFKS